MPTCPYCHASALVKDGLNPNGSQRFTCKVCHRTHTPEPNANGYAPELRQQALELYLQGMGQRAIGRFLKVNHQSVANWIKAAAPPDTPSPQPATAEVIELDELYTFVGQKKTKSI